MSKLIGTDPNQVPSNADLGTAAFHDVEDFITSRGGSLSAIKSRINDSATRLAIYDTTKDSDGGAWRKRTSRTSWYNEELNTEVRGSRREFPSVVLIVAGTNRVTFYDVDDPTLPMWMVWEDTGVLAWASGTTPTRIPVAALNGIFVWATDNRGGGVADFVTDYIDIFHASTEYALKDSKISSRRTSSFLTPNDGRGHAMASSAYRGVAIGLHSGCKSYNRGLPKPMCFVSHSNGIEVLSFGEQGTFAISGDTQYDIIVTSDNHLVSQNQNYINVQKDTIDRITPQTGQSYVGNHSGNISFPRAFTTDARWANVTLQPSPADTSANLPIAGSTDYFAVGGPEGLTLLDMNINKQDHSGYSDNYDQAMACYITPTHNSGWQIGQPIFATLCSTEPGYIKGRDYIPDCTQHNTGRLTSESYSDGANSFNMVYATGTEGYVQLAVTGLTPKKEYVLSFKGSHAFTPTNSVYLNRVNDDEGSTNLAYSSDGTGTTNSQIITWTAVGTTALITLYSKYQGTLTYSQLKLTTSEKDMSTYNKGFHQIGTIKKEPVAPGAELMAYGPFSTSSYIQQEFSDKKQLAQRAWTISGWYKISNTDASYRVAMYHNTVGSVGEGIQVVMDPTHKVYCYIYGPTEDIEITASDTSNDGKWHHFLLRQTAGNMIELFIDGQSQGRGEGTYGNINNSDAVTTLGCYRATDTLFFPGQLSLWKMTEGSPSNDQVTRIYEDEKMLFLPNSKATLIGKTEGSVNAAAVKAVAYDKYNKIMYAGTARGKSVFNGITRVGHNNTAITSRLMAVDGLVSEE